MLRRWKLTVKTFSSDEQGAVALLFGLMTFMLFFIGAIAVDYSRITDMRSRISGAVDAASLAAGRALLDGNLSDSEIVALATTYFKENVKSARGLGTVGEPTINVHRDQGTIDIDVQSTVKMTLARIGGFTDMSIPVTSEATYAQKDIEVGMALDITGSMNEVRGGIPKIDALKSAFELFADRLIPEQKSSSQRVRIGLAPYSSGVNVGSFAASVTQNRSNDGCVTERKAAAINDLPASTEPFLVKQDGKDDIDNSDGATPKNAFECPTAELVPLSDDKASLVQAVNGFTAQGWTAGHLGVQWAWNIVSDQWGSTFGGNSAPDAYARVAQDKLIKAVVLMTDGSFNTAFHGNKSAKGTWSKTQAIAMCNAMKAPGKDVVVFAVAFDAPKDAQETLKACATPGDGYYANAANPDELTLAFANFATKLTSLRVSK